MTWIDWTIVAVAVVFAVSAFATAVGRWFDERDRACTPREVVIGQVEVPPQLTADVAAAAERRGVKGGEW